LNKAQSAKEGFKESSKLESNKSILDHYLFYAIKGDCLLSVGKVNLGKKATEKAYLLEKIKAL